MTLKMSVEREKAPLDNRWCCNENAAQQRRSITRMRVFIRADWALSIIQKLLGDRAIASDSDLSSRYKGTLHNIIVARRLNLRRHWKKSVRYRYEMCAFQHLSPQASVNLSRIVMAEYARH